MVDRSGATPGSGTGSVGTAPTLTPDASVSSKSGSASAPGATGSLLIAGGLCQEPPREPEPNRKRAPLTLEPGARQALPVVTSAPCLALENTMTRINKWSSGSLMTILAVALAAGCV